MLSASNEIAILMVANIKSTLENGLNSHCSVNILNVKIIFNDTVSAKDT